MVVLVLVDSPPPLCEWHMCNLSLVDGVAGNPATSTCWPNRHSLVDLNQSRGGLCYLPGIMVYLDRQAYFSLKSAAIGIFVDPRALS